jgi:hypothetical protein
MGQDPRQRWGVAFTAGLGASIAAVVWQVFFTEPGPLVWFRRNLNLLAFATLLTLVTSEFVGPWLEQHAPAWWRRVFSVGSTAGPSSQPDRLGIRIRRQSLRFAAAILFAFIVAVGKTALDQGLQGASFLWLRTTLLTWYLLVGAQRDSRRAATLGVVSGAVIGIVGGGLLALLLRGGIPATERVGASIIEWTIWGLAAGVAIDRTNGPRTGVTVFASLALGAVLANRIESWIWGPYNPLEVLYLLFPAIGWGLVLAVSRRAFEPARD